MPDLDPLDRDFAIRTILGEAANQGPEGQAAIAHVIRNRLGAGGYGDSVSDIVTAPRQFTPWTTRTGELLGYRKDSPEYQNVGGIVDRVWKGDLPDNTGGATHFANVGASDPVNQRGWIADMQRKGVVQIGAHTFGSPDSAPGRRTMAVPSLDDFEAAPAASGAAPLDIRSPAQRAGERIAAGPAIVPAKPAATAALSLDDFEAAPAGPTRPVATPTQFAENEADVRRLEAPMLAESDRALVGQSSPLTTAAASALNTGLLSVPRNAQAAIDLAKGKLGTGPEYGSFGEAYEHARAVDEARARQNPIASGAGTVAGVVGGAVALPALRVAQGAGLAGRAITNAATGGLYGLAGGALETHDPAQAAISGGLGVAGGAVLTPVLEKVGTAFANSSLGRAALSRWIDAPQSLVQPNGQLTGNARQIIRTVVGDDADAVPALTAAMQKAFAEKGATPEVAREALLGHFGITGSRGQVGQDFTQQRFENLAATGGHGPEAQKAAQQFFMGVPEAGVPGQAGEIAAAKADIGNRVGGGVGIESPYGAGEMIADQARAAAEYAAQREQSATQFGQAVLGHITRGGVDATDAGAMAAQGIRNAAAESEARVNAAYGAARDAPGTFTPNSFNTLGRGVAQGLEARGIEIDPQLTPAAQRGLNMLSEVPPGERTMGDVEQLRKRLVQNWKLVRNDPNRREDARAARHIIGEFENQVEQRLQNGLFSGDEGALRLYQNARQQARQHFETFRPRGPGDDVGAMMRNIVERDAQPGEVANFLYGNSSLPGNNGRAERAAGRVRDVLGENSPEWRAVQQGLIARALGTDPSPARMAERIQGLLTGPQRNLADQVLTAEQNAGLRQFQRAVQTARAAREAVPQWVQDLGKKGFEPQAVIDEALGRATPGGLTTSARFVEGLKGYFGEGSPEFNALRQAAWQKLTTQPKGVTDWGPHVIAQRIGKFFEGEGKSLSRVLYTDADRAEMKAFAAALRTVAPMQVLGKASMPNSDSTSGLMGVMRERLGAHADKILGMLGSHVMGPIGVPIAQGLGSALSKRVGSTKDARRAAEAFSPLPAAPPAPLEITVTPGLGTAAGLAQQ